MLKRLPPTLVQLLSYLLGISIFSIVGVLLGRPLGVDRVFEVIGLASALTVAIQVWRERKALRGDELAERIRVG